MSDTTTTRSVRQKCDVADFKLIFSTSMAKNEEEKWTDEYFYWSILGGSQYSLYFHLAAQVGLLPVARLDFYVQLKVIENCEVLDGQRLTSSFRLMVELPVSVAT